MTLSLRTYAVALGFCAAAAAFSVGMYLPAPHFVFVVISLAFVGPIWLAAAAVGARWDWRLSTTLASVAVLTGYIVGGSVGWALVPPEWTASLWVTIDASMNAAKYGGTFEHNAERALLYFLYSGILGALIMALLSVGTTRTLIRRARSARSAG